MCITKEMIEIILFLYHSMHLSEKKNGFGLIFKHFVLSCHFHYLLKK